MTLLELLLVMFILALVLGGGVGLFASLDLGRRQASGVVRNVIRSAQNTAMASGAPARVRLDLEQGELWAEALQVVGTYQFEERSVEGYGPQGKTGPDWFDPLGFVGAAFHPAGLRGATAEIPIESDPAFDFTLGFALECALLRERETGGRVLSIGAAESATLALELGANGSLRARFRARIGGPESERPGGQVILQSEPGLLPVQRWTRVRMQYDRAAFTLFVDGALVAVEQSDAYVWKVDGPLILSDDQAPFPGKLDALVVSAMLAGERARLPDSVRFTVSSPTTIQFRSGGGLDRGYHVDPPRITLELADGSSQLVTVGFYGTVE